jgi:hypothetical protein
MTTARGVVPPAVQVRLTRQTVAILDAIRGGHTWGSAIAGDTGVSMSATYATLRRLREARWVTAHVEPAEVAHACGRPQRIGYELTGLALDTLGWPR